MSDLILAVPSKGRLEENAAAIFANAGVPLKRAGSRGYRGRVSGIDNIDVQYVSASEIAARLADGSVHMGITGEDLLREEIPDMDSVVQLVLPLGFGRADVVVAMPDGWVDVQNMADLAEVASEFRARNGKRLRVATKYTHLTTDFFARHGLIDYRLVESFGATEAAPNAGAAEAIVDITSTGATLTANQLRVPQDGIILKSEANLAAALSADWPTPARTAAKALLARLDARQAANAMVQVQFVSTGEAQKQIAPEAYAAFQNGYEARLIAGAVTAGADAAAVSGNIFLIPAARLDEARNAWMQTSGCDQAIVTRPDFIFERRNRLYERLAGALA